MILVYHNSVDVDDTYFMQRTVFVTSILVLPRVVTASFIAVRSVCNSSSTLINSMMAGSNPAVKILLKQDF